MSVISFFNIYGKYRESIDWHSERYKTAFFSSPVPCSFLITTWHTLVFWSGNLKYMKPPRPKAGGNFPGIWSIRDFFNFNSETFVRKRPKYPSKWYIFPQNCLGKRLPNLKFVFMHASAHKNCQKSLEQKQLDSEIIPLMINSSDYMEVWRGSLEKWYYGDVRQAKCSHFHPIWGCHFFTKFSNKPNISAKL